jgi:polyisoprenoid-binding protein YceI/protocatechuate 3,4-dioxygenase beta subunit
MARKILLVVAILLGVAVLVATVWYVRLTAPVAVNNTPPVAATLVALTTTPSVAVYRIDPTRSEVFYRVDETFFDYRGLVTAVGTTKAVAGDLLLNKGNLAASRVGEIVVDISQFQSDEPSRDNAIRNEWLESARYPHATFKNASLQEIPSSWREGEPFRFKMVGDLTVRTTTRNATWDVEVTLDGDELRGRATTQIKMTDFGFQPPSLRILSVEDDVALTIDFVAVASGSSTTAQAAQSAQPTEAMPTVPDPTPAGRACAATVSEGNRPNYKPGAPVRDSVGQGYVLAGTVLSSAGCAPLSNARIELWLTNPEGQYDDAHRATVLTEGAGAFRFESNVPGAYGGGVAHIHMAVSAEWHDDVVITHLVEEGATEATLEFVLPTAGR